MMEPAVRQGSDSVEISRVCGKDQSRFLAAVARSQNLHAPWVAPPADAAAFRAYLDKYAGEANLSYLVRVGEDLAACINLNEIVRGGFQSAYLGYYAFMPFAGRGYMKRGLARVIALAFDELGLHRLEANIQPDNRSSVALVKALGFRLEGFSPRYLQIDGVWRDHERYALTVEDWQQRPQ